jgi:hypothetical protein
VDIPVVVAAAAVAGPDPGVLDLVLVVLVRGLVLVCSGSGFRVCAACTSRSVVGSESAQTQSRSETSTLRSVHVSV